MQSFVIYKSNSVILEIDPETGKTTPIKMPFDAEDICFDKDGVIYLRTDIEVVRYDLATWREIPWDYGEERKQVFFSSSLVICLFSSFSFKFHFAILCYLTYTVIY